MTDEDAAPADADIVRIVRDEDDLEAAVAIRWTVFVDEQGVPAEAEWDGREDESTHFLAEAGGRPVGTARLRPLDAGAAKVERVAVLADARGEGRGGRLMDAVESTARERGIDELHLHAQTRVVGFYARHGYERVGDEFEQAGIPHVAMCKSLER